MSIDTRPATASAVHQSQPSSHRRLRASLMSAFHPTTNPLALEQNTAAEAVTPSWAQDSSPWLSQPQLHTVAPGMNGSSQEHNPIQGQPSQNTKPENLASDNNNPDRLVLYHDDNDQRRSRWRLDGLTNNIKTIARRASISMKSHILSRHNRKTSDSAGMPTYQEADEPLSRLTLDQNPVDSGRTSNSRRNRSSFFRGSIPNFHSLAASYQKQHSSTFTESSNEAPARALSSAGLIGPALEGHSPSCSPPPPAVPNSQTLSQHPSLGVAAGAAARASAAALRPGARPASAFVVGFRSLNQTDSATPSITSLVPGAATASAQSSSAAEATTGTSRPSPEPTQRLSRHSIRYPRRLVPWRHTSLHNITFLSQSPSVSSHRTPFKPFSENVDTAKLATDQADDDMCDSVVDLRKLDTTASSSSNRRLDPALNLPPELFLLTLSYLDASTLSQCLRVSKAWNQNVLIKSVWKKVFFDKYTPNTRLDPPPRLIGDMGLGPKKARGLDFHKMSKARSDIENNWKSRNAKAVYFNGHTDSVYCCQFDEKKLITGSRDKTIRVWCMKTFKCLLVIAGADYKPVSDPPERQLATHPTATIMSLPSLNGTVDGDAIFYSPAEFHTASILSLQYDDEILVTASSDQTCLVWDIKTFKPFKRLRHHTAGVLDVCIDPNYIITCSKDATICVWSRKTYKHLHTLHGHQAPVNAVQIRGNRLASASGDGYARLWCLDSMTCLGTFQSETRGLATVEFTNDGRYILTGGNDQVIYKFDTLTRRCVHIYGGHTKLVRSLFLDSYNNRIISGSYDQSIRVYTFDDNPRPEPAEGEAEEHHRPPTKSDICQEYSDWTTSWILSTKSDYRRVVATSQDGRALMMDFGWGVEGADLLQESSDIYTIDVTTLGK